MGHSFLLCTCLVFFQIFDKKYIYITIKITLKYTHKIQELRPSSLKNHSETSHVQRQTSINLSREHGPCTSVPVSSSHSFLSPPPVSAN